MAKGRFSISMFLISILAGGLYAVPAEFMYRFLKLLSIPRPIVTAIYFIGLFLVIGLALFIGGKFIRSVKSRAINGKMWALTFVGIIVLSLLFEFLYDLTINFKKSNEIDSYVFLIDISGSTLDTDPTGMRYTAVNKLLEDKKDDFPYAVYLFSDGAQCVRDMKPKSEVTVYDNYEDYGMTEIRGTFETVYHDLETGKLTVGKNCRVVMITDGYATDIDMWNKGTFIKEIGQFEKYGITISTVGFYDADDQLMTEIAEKGDGVYVSVDNVQGLEEALKTATGINNVRLRDLLGYRSGDYMNILLAIMRILFIALLGMVIGVQKTVVCDKFLNTNSVILGSFVLSMVAGVFIEVGMNALGLNEFITRLLTCILVAITFVRIDPGNMHNTGDEVYRYDL